MNRVRRDLGPPSAWAKWGGGWPDDIEAALVDAVFSARVRYTTSRGKGVLHQVRSWANARRRRRFTTTAQAAKVGKVGPEAWAAAFGNRQRARRRPSEAPDGPTKAAAVLEGAQKLASIGVEEAADVTDTTVDKVKQVMLSVGGVGHATTNYFLMLLGRPGVKPDRMVLRFLAATLGCDVTSFEADWLVTAAASALNVPAHELDHAIWAYQRAQ